MGCSLQESTWPATGLHPTRPRPLRQAPPTRGRGDSEGDEDAVGPCSHKDSVGDPLAFLPMAAL